MDAKDPAGHPRAHRTKQKFTADEDRVISLMVESHGPQKWRLVAEKLHGRTARQCRERWVNYLSPSVTTAPWTAAEDALLREQVSGIGPLWSRIARLFEGRTDVLLKHRYLKLMRQDLKAARKSAKKALRMGKGGKTGDEGGAFWLDGGNEGGGSDWEYYIFAEKEDMYGDPPVDLGQFSLDR
jgi:hypothetical protein